MNLQRVSIFGLGYVGSVTAACMSRHGHTVIGVDSNPAKVEALKSGHAPLVEAQLQELIAYGVGSGRLHATNDIDDAVINTDVSFLCVPTPSMPSGKLDLRSIERVSKEIGSVLRRKHGFHTIVVRSTVLPGTCEEIVIPAVERQTGKTHGETFAVCANPEFLREGSAVDDFNNPSMTVFGSVCPSHLENLRELFSFVTGTIFETSLRVAEMVKYTCNAFHALKVAFANEIGTICSQFEVDPNEVSDIFLSDTKLNISRAYLKPGFAFGGSCLPKDLRALLHRCKELDLKMPLLESILPSNSEHIERVVAAVLALGVRRVGILGLSFKTGTDDLRESPMVHLVKRLLGEGMILKVWDDEVALGKLIGSNRRFIEEVIPHIGSLMTDNIGDLLDHADALVLGTKRVSKDDLVAKLRPGQQVINLLDLASMGPCKVALESEASAVSEPH